MPQNVRGTQHPLLEDTCGCELAEPCHHPGAQVGRREMTGLGRFRFAADARWPNSLFIALLRYVLTS
jgi:hypothetical protein